jgi:hypothetical protein
MLAALEPLLPGQVVTAALGVPLAQQAERLPLEPHAELVVQAAAQVTQFLATPTSHGLPLAQD